MGLYQSGFDGGVHNFATRIYYDDTDAAGIVYYANYLKIAERARSEMLRDLAIDNRYLIDTYGIAFAVRRCLADYRQPAHLDDALTVRSRMLKVTGARLHADQRILRGEDELVQIDIQLACITLDGRPARIPGDVRALLGGLVEAT